VRTDLADRDFDAIVLDGSTVHLRDIRPDDGSALVAFHSRLSENTVVLRFFGAHPELSKREVEHFTHVDGIDRVALVAERSGGIVAVGRYDRIPGRDDAEVAFVVADAYQGNGIGTILIEQLVRIARSHGIRRLVAETLTENRRMLDLIRNTGFAHQYEGSMGVLRVVLDISQSREAREDHVGPPGLPTR
jgi:GNAT superfamily N-acetyltransferase